MPNKLLTSLVVGVSLIMTSSPMAESPSSIDSILLSNEFKEEERSQFWQLPASTVSGITKRLNDVPANDPRTGRLFEFLVLKVKQFQDVLPLEDRKAAVEALKSKAKGETAVITEYRRSLLESLEPSIKALIEEQMVAPEYTGLQQERPMKSPLSSTQSESPPASLEKTPDAQPLQTTQSHEPFPPLRWLLFGVVLAAPLGLLWALLKMWK